MFGFAKKKAHLTVAKATGEAHMSRFMKSAVAAVAALVAVQTASAAIITVPEGLGVGDSYRLIFVTSTTTTATESSAAYYNNFVNSLAQSVPELAALGTTWTVAGNLVGINTWQNTGTTGDDAIPIYRLNGSVFAANYTALKGAPTVPVSYNELGVATVARVWTGMSEAMSVPGMSSPIGNGGSVEAGSSDNAWYTWGFHGMDPNTENRLYAMSGVITVIPEPATFGMLGAAAIAMLLRRRFAK
jgi:hypothetical protein